LNRQIRQKIAQYEHYFHIYNTDLKHLPNYTLYGESAMNPLIDGFHIELIADRSQIYEWEIKPHRHDDLLQILHISKGTGQYTIGDLRSDIQAPCLLIAPRLAPHGFSFNRNIEGHVITISHHRIHDFFQQEMSILSTFENGGCVQMKRQTKNWGDICNIVENLKTEFFGSKQWRPFAVNSLLVSLVVMIAREANSGQISTQQNSKAISHINQFKELLDEKFREHLNIDFYAQKIGITQTQLNRVCKQTLGKSALTVINQRIIMEAERDLLYSSLSVKEIAYSLGFQDAAYFTRFFKKNRMQSPNFFRKNAKEKLSISGTNRRA
jgi:AraC family transcriptional regulator, transcriptional activator of pobA